MLYLYGVYHQYLGLCYSTDLDMLLIFKQDMCLHVTLRFSADESVTLQVSEWMDGWMDRRRYGSTDGWVNEQKDGWMGDWMEAGTDRWKNGSMDEWTGGWMDGWLTVWRLLLNLTLSTILFKYLFPLLDFKFHETQGLILSVFAFSGPHTALDWWQVQQQVKNTCLLKINDSSLMLLFLSLSNIILRREFLDREKNGNLEIEMLCWYFFSFKLYKETACGKFW